MKYIISMCFSVFCAAMLLTGCNNKESELTSTDSDTVQISGAGIKGPLAFADAKIFAFDPSYPDYYDKTSPIAIAITNQYAEIQELSVPRKIKPPYILSINGSNGIDLNTGVAPVIDTLLTVVTADMLVDNSPVFATPLTTLAFHMARVSKGDIQHNKLHIARSYFNKALGNASNIVSHTFGIGQYTDIDLFRDPLVINDHTDDLAEQELAVNHRATVEAFATKVYSLSLLKDTTSDAILQRLALDLHSDGIIDNADDGAFIGEIDPTILSEDPMELFIPNSAYQIKDIMMLMDEERVLIGTDMGPTFFMEAIAFPEGTASTNITPTKTSISDPLTSTDPVVTPKSFPVELFGATPEESSVVVNVYKPADAVNGIMTLSIYDADYKNEGELVINGNTPIALFGSLGVGANDNSLADITISTPASYWNDGDNTLIFRHINTAGYTINGVTVSFDASSTPDSGPVATLSVYSINFGSQDVGGTSEPVTLTLTNNGAGPLNISGISISTGFTEANNCNNQVPADGMCFFDIQFVPTTTGTITGTLAIIGDDAVGTHTVNLSGTGSDGTQALPDNPGNSAGKLLYVDFSNRTIGPYEKADIKTDFQFDMNGYSEGDAGMSFGSLDIASDPTGSGRGNVMRVNRNADRAGASIKSGGMAFRADFSKREDVYFAYDMYLAPDHEWVKHQKNPGLLTGTILQAGHSYGEKPTAEGLIAFNATITSDSPPAWARGYGALSTYFYDADTVQRNDFWNLNDPTLEDIQGQYNQPTGYWITVELRVKMNTVTKEGVSGLRDGLMEVWVTDPQRWVGARKVSSQRHRWRITSAMGVDGISMSNYYGGDPSDPDNKTSQQQYHYYDNFIVSTSPITH